MAPTIDFDTVAEANWTETERANAEQVHRFIQLLMNDHDFPAVREEFGGSVYTQHNRTMADGLEGVLESVERLVNRFPEFSYDVKQLVSSGDTVIAFSHATMRASHRDDDRKGWIIFDMWRLEDGRLVEHWDSLQALDLPMRLFQAATGGRVRNSNGPF
ncbi:MAG: ester cyclase [Acidimicrobiia bacterium]|nr:ester cyclase [Acidimicrobiia bacterium]